MKRDLVKLIKGNLECIVTIDRVYWWIADKNKECLIGHRP